MPGLMDLAQELRDQTRPDMLSLEAADRLGSCEHKFKEDHGPRIIPRKQLVSPMMGICHETRRFAQRFYPV
ncbi:hypothetical protein PG993_006959 [Apiospora rasikravindrae]|uniref:Uncharacterized protein n=1 Tax=Apiospora rasikravindrae TaxID=990691 RepID=A0ABR1SW56_9PEZI